MFSTIKKLLGPMRCPVCGDRMKPWSTSQTGPTKEERFVDPSGHGVYLCHNMDCPGAGNEPLVYRRVLSGVEDRRDAISRATDETRAEQLQQWRVQNERLNELTVWLRTRYPGYFRGQFKDQVDVAIYVMSKGKDVQPVAIDGGGPDGT